MTRTPRSARLGVSAGLCALAMVLVGGCGSSSSSSGTAADRDGGDRASSSSSSSRMEEAEAEAEVESEGQSVAEGDAGRDGETACASPATVPTASASAELPDGVAVPDGATVTKVGRGQVEGFAPGDVSDLLRTFRSQLAASGAKITAADDEVREAELRFDTAGGEEGEVRLNRSSCATGTTNFVILADG